MNQASTHSLLAEVKGQSLTVEELAEQAVKLAAELLNAAQAQQTDAEKKQAAKIKGMMDDPMGKLMTMALSDQAFRSHSPGRINNQIRHLIEGYGVPAYFADWEQVALELGNSASNVTSPYDGTALIAAAHLGHKEVVRTLVEAGAPLDHVNNLGWTALLEVVILGDGGPDHVESLRHLLEGGADRAIADPGGVTPLEHARRRGYADMVGLLEAE